MHFLRRIEWILTFWDGELRADILCYTPEEFKEKVNELGIVKKAVEEGIVLE